MFIFEKLKELFEEYKTRNKCCDEHGKDGKCSGLFGGSVSTEFLEECCMDCPHFVYPLLKEHDKMGSKFRPIAIIERHTDADGRHEWDDIDYYCPKCRKHLKGYNKEVGCTDCEIFFDWGNKEPRIEIVKSVVWN